MIRSVGAHFVRVDSSTFLKYAVIRLDQDGVVLGIDLSEDGLFREGANTEFYSGIIAELNDQKIEIGSVAKLKVVESTDIENYSGYGNILI